MDINQIIESVKQMSAREKATIAHCLIASLETRQDKGVDQAWAELARERFDELASGKVKPVSWEEIKKQATS